jgi:hypothetical protein
MPYSPRINNYETGVITANGVGSASYYTVHAITGRIFRIAILTASAGSVTVTESGTNEIIFTKGVASGTNYSTYYPVIASTVGNTGAALTAGSGNLWEKPASNDALQIQHIAGSNLSFTNVKIYYL